MNKKGSTIAANNINLEYHLIDNGSTTIVFLNGFRMPFKSWDKVYPELISENSIILFNRRGVGESAKATEAQDGITIINEIRSFFSNLNLRPPYILVAHSFGGLLANLYSRIYPNEVSGVVFVDSPYPQEVIEQKKNTPPFILNTINEGVKSIEKLFDKYKYSEDEQIEETIAQISKAGGFPHIPIAVVSGTKKMPFVPQKAFQIHNKFQANLMELSSKSTQYLCDESGHFPQITEPDKVIIAIKNTIHEATTR